MLDDLIVPQIHAGIYKRIRGRCFGFFSEDYSLAWTVYNYGMVQGTLTLRRLQGRTESWQLDTAFPSKRRDDNALRTVLARFSLARIFSSPRCQAKTRAQPTDRPTDRASEPTGFLFPLLRDASTRRNAGLVSSTGGPRGEKG